MKASSSDYFAFAAVICRDSNRDTLRTALEDLVRDAGRREGTVLHWSKNMKHHTLRRHAANQLAALPVRLIYVAVPKATVRQTSKLSTDTVAYYNYAARMLLERIGLFTADHQRAERRHNRRAECQTKVTFGRVKGFQPADLRSYVARLRRKDECRPWCDHLTEKISVLGQTEEELLQWADIAAGAFDAAVKTDRFGNHEPTYLQALGPQIRRVNDRILGYGMKSLGDDAWLRELPWWEDRWWMP